MATTADSVRSPGGDSLTILPPPTDGDSPTLLPPLSAEEMATQLFGYQRPPDRPKITILPPIVPPAKTLADQQEVLQPPRDLGFADRLGMAIREAASPLIGQTPVQAAQRATAEQRLAPEFRGGRSDAQVQTETYSPSGDVLPDRTKAPLTSSLYRGGRQLEDTGLALAQWMATMAGIDTPALDEQKKFNQEKIAENPPLVHGPDEIRGLGDALTYALEQVGQNLPTAVPGMGGGFVAGKVAAKTAAGMAADALATRVAAAQAAGATAGSIAQETGSIFSDATDDPTKRNRLTALLSLAHGIPAGILDAVGEKLALGRLPGGHEVAAGPLENFLSSKGSRSFFINGLAKLGDAGLEQWVTQAPTEYFQTLIEQSGKQSADLAGENDFWSKYFDQLTSPAAQKERAEAALGGAISGVATGVGFQLPGVVGKIADAKAAVRAVTTIRQEFDRQAAQPKPETTGTPTTFQAAPESATLPATQAESGLTAEQPTFGTVTPVDQAILRNRFDQAVAADKARAAASTAPAAQSPVETVQPTALPDFSQGLPTILSLLDHPVTQLQQQFDQQEATPANAQAAPPAAERPSTAPETPVAPTVASEAIQAPAATVTPKPAVPPPAPVRENLNKQQVANADAAAVREQQQPTLPADTQAAITYFQQNPQHAQVVADYMAGDTAGNYKSGENFLTAVDRAIGGLPESGGDSDSYVRQRMQDKVFQYVARKKEKAFTQKGDQTVLRTGPGGFPLHLELERVVKNWLRDEESTNITGRNKVNLTADVPEGQRAPAETIAAAQDRPELLTDQLNVRQQLVQGLVPGSVELLGTDVIVRDLMGRTSGGGGVNMQSTGTADVPWQVVSKWVKANQKQVLQQLQTIVRQQEAKNVSASEVMQSLIAAYASHLTGTGSGMTIDQVRQAVTSVFGRLSANVLIVNNRTLATPSGNPIKGMFVGGLKGARIVLNAANLNNAFDAAIALLHESLHQVWDLPEVQTAVTKLMQAVTGRISGYDPATVREELSVRGITDQWATDQQRALWQKLVDTAWSAVRRIFGAEPTTVEMRRQLYARAIQSINGQTVSPRGVVRYYNGFQVFRNQEELSTATSDQTLTASGRTDLEQIAGATKRLIPDRIDRTLAAWRSISINPQAPAPVRALDRVRRRVGQRLEWLSDLRQLTPPEQDLSAVNATVQDVAARAILETDQRIRRYTQQTVERTDLAQDRLSKAARDFQKVGPLELQAKAAATVASNLVDSYQEQLDARSSLSPSLPAEQKAAIDAAKKALGVIKTVGPAVTTAIQSIARVRPLGVDPLTFVHNEQATGWPSFGRTMPMTQVVYDFLAGSGNQLNLAAGQISNGGPSVVTVPFRPALDGTTAELDRVRRVIDSRQDAQQVIDNVSQLFRSLGQTVKKNVTPRQFAALYDGWLTKHQQAADEARAYSREFQRATDTFNTLALEAQVLDQTVADPQYQAQLTAATLDKNARAKRFDDGTIIEDRDLATGDWLVRSPVTKQPLSLRTALNDKEINQTVSNAQSLINDIDTWLTIQPNNPPLEQTYRRIKSDLQASWLGAINAMNLTGNVQPIPLTRDWSVRLPAALISSPLTTIPALTKPLRRVGASIFGNLQGRDLTYNPVGSVAGPILNQYMRRTDLAVDAVRSAELNAQHGTDAIRESQFKQAEKHGLMKQNPSAAQAIDQYGQEVVNSVFSNSQDAGHDISRPGDQTPWGQTIQPADIQAAKIQHGYNQQVHEGVSHRQGGVLSSLSLMTETDRYFREAVAYGLTMMRRSSDFGLNFSRRWSEAPDAASKLALLNDKYQFDGVVNGMIDTRNTSYKLSDPIQQQAIKNHYAANRQNYRFDTMDDFLDYMGDERARLINAQQGVPVTTPFEQRQVAELRLLNDIDRSVRLFLDQSSSGAEMDNRVQGVGQAQMKTLSGRSSFSQPRGAQVAPNTFYDYTLGTDRSRLQYNSAAMRYFQKQELDQLNAVVTSFEREQQRMVEEYKAIRKQSPGRPEFVTRLQYAAKQRADVKQEKLLTTMGNLDRVLSDLRSVQSGLSRLMESANTEVGQPLRMISKLENVTSMGKLASAAGRFTDLLSQDQISPLLVNHYLASGKWRILQTLMTLGRQVGQLPKVLYRAALQMTVGSRPLNTLLKNNPSVFLGLANHFSRQLLARQADINYLHVLGSQPPLPFKRQAGRSMYDMRLMKTSGQVTTREGGLGEAAFNVLNIPGVLGGLAGTWGNGQLDSFGLQTQLAGVAAVLDRMKAQAVKAGRVRELAGIPSNQALLPAEIGEDSQTSLHALRDFLSPAGTVEHVFDNYYQRRKAAQQAGQDPAAVPFLDAGQQRDVANRILSRGNLINDSSRGEATKGKGTDRIPRSIFFRFMPYPLHFAEWISQSTRRDFRDSPKAQWGHIAAISALIPIFGMIALANLGGGQWLRELQTGKVASTPTLTALAGDGSPTAFAKAWALGGSSLFLPLLGDYMSAILSGQKGRDPTDLSSMVPGVGLLANLGKMVTQTVQSGDLFYPLTGFLKSTSPLFETVYNRTVGASELDQLNAARAFRSAAPSDIETRQPTAGSTKLTPQSPDIRDALRAAATGDQAAFNKAVESATAKVVAAGGDPATARKKILQSIQARSPERSVFGRTLLPDEMARVTARMNPSQIAAVNTMREISGRIDQWTGQKHRAPTGKRSATGLTARLGGGPRLPRLRQPKQLRPKLAAAGRRML